MLFTALGASYKVKLFTPVRAGKPAILNSLL